VAKAETIVLDFAPIVHEHMKVIDAKYDSLIRRKIEVAILLGVQDKAEAKRLAGRRSLRSIFEEAHEQLQQGRGIPHDEFWRQVEQSRRAKNGRRRKSKRPSRRR
jgi:hypothetical protein